MASWLIEHEIVIGCQLIAKLILDRILTMFFSWRVIANIIVTVDRVEFFNLFPETIKIMQISQIKSRCLK